MIQHLLVPQIQENSAESLIARKFGFATNCEAKRNTEYQNVGQKKQPQHSVNHHPQLVFPC